MFATTGDMLCAMQSIRSRALCCLGRSADRNADSNEHFNKVPRRWERTSWSVPGDPIPASIGSSLRYVLTFASGANPGLRRRQAAIAET